MIPIMISRSPELRRRKWNRGAVMSTRVLQLRSGKQTILRMPMQPLKVAALSFKLEFRVGHNFFYGQSMEFYHHLQGQSLI